MSPTINIRPYHPPDKERLLEILNLNVPKSFAKSEVEDFSFYLDHEIEKYFVAETGNQIVGAGGINYDEDGKTGKISWDFINPDFHGLGIGSALLKYRLEILKTEGLETISVRTSQLAFRFYEKHGFVLKEVIKDYWAEGFDLYSMFFDRPEKA